MSVSLCWFYTRTFVCARDENRSNSEVIPCGPTLELFNSDAQTLQSDKSWYSSEQIVFLEACFYLLP